MSTLADDLAAVLPSIDPSTGDFLQILTRQQYTDMVGPHHADRFYRFTSYHPPGQALQYDLEQFLDRWWTGDVTAVVRWNAVGEFVNVVGYRRTTPDTIYVAMAVGEIPASKTLRCAFYDIGIRHWVMRAPEKRRTLYIARGWTPATEPDPHGLYEFTQTLDQRPSSDDYVIPPHVNRGRR